MSDTQLFELDPAFLSKFKNKQPKWGPLGYITYKRTYARKLDNGAFEEFWQTLKRVVEGTYRIQQKHCAGLRLPWSNVKAQNSAQEMYTRMWEFKFLPPGRGLWAMGTSIVDKIGSASLNNCFEYNTEIITRDGIKCIGDLQSTTQTLLTSNGKWVDAPIKSFGIQQLYKLTVSRQGVEKEIFTTANHRWFAKDRRGEFRDHGHGEFLTTELRPGKHKLQYVFGHGVKTALLQPSPVGIAHGFSFGDGTTTRGDHANRTMLIGDKDKQVLKYFGCSPQRECPEVNGIEVSALPNYFKELPSIRENRSYLFGWLAGYFAADGSVKNGQVVLSSSKLENIQFVRDVCSVLGIGTYSVCNETRISNLTNKPHTMYNVSLMRDTLDVKFFILKHHAQSYTENGSDEVDKRYWTVKDVQPTDRFEEVYCATVPETACFALADNILTGNCGFASTLDLKTSFSAPFCFLMDMSMLGVGVGGDTRGAGSLTVKRPFLSRDVHVVPDTREGWVDLVRIILDSYVRESAQPEQVDYSQVRPVGTAINGFGGTASGPEPLIELVQSIKDILNPLVGHKITSTAIVDLFNVIGRCVVAGNVRRSAEIMFGDPDDVAFLELKDPDKHATELKHHRWASNNSIFATVGMDYSEVAKRTATNGEPGFFWLDNARAFSRMGHPADWRDEKAVGSNPCSEQTLEAYELCNLVETFPARHKDVDDYKRTLKFAYLYAKTVTLVPTHDVRTNAVMMRNRRIGTSQSGIIQAINKFGLRAYFNLCDEGYAYLAKTDKLYSNWLCVPESIKRTSVKPSGTVSLLPGATPGMHYPHSEYYIRNIRCEKNSKLVQILEKAGYPVEDDFYTPNTSVVSVPVHEAHYAKGKSDITMWEQLELTAQIQHHWADNQVSVTVTFNPGEAQDIQRALEFYETRLKSVSFLPVDGGGYMQAPYTEIDKEGYEKLASKLKPYDLATITHDTTDAFCDGDKCMMPSKTVA